MLPGKASAIVWLTSRLSGDLQGSTKTDEVYEKYMTDALYDILMEFLSQQNLTSLMQI